MGSVECRYCGCHHRAGMTCDLGKTVEADRLRGGCWYGALDGTPTTYTEVGVLEDEIIGTVTMSEDRTKALDPTDNVLQFPSPKLEQHGEYTVGTLPTKNVPQDLVGRFLFTEDKTQHITVRSCPGADAWCLTPDEAEVLAVELIAQATKARLKMEHDDNE